MPQSERRKVAAECFFKLTQRLKKVLTHGFGKRFLKEFWCDGHPWLCVPCVRLRYGLIYGSLPFALEILSVRGSFIWTTRDAWYRPETFLWLQGILSRRIKERYDKIRKKSSYESVDEVVTC